MVRKVTVTRFEAWKGEAENVEEFFRLMQGTEATKGLRFRDACVALKLPYTLMYQFVHVERPDLKVRYEALLAAKADDLAHESLEIADGVTPQRDAVGKAKLQVEVRQQLASKWDRDRYGDRLQVDKTVSVSVDAGLLGRASALLEAAAVGKAEARVGPKVVEGETLGDTLTMPALPERVPGGSGE